MNSPRARTPAMPSAPETQGMGGITTQGQETPGNSALGPGEAWLPRVGDIYQSSETPARIVELVERVGPFYFVRGKMVDNPTFTGVVIIAPELAPQQTFDDFPASSWIYFKKLIEGRPYISISFWDFTAFHFWDWPQQKQHAIGLLNARLRELGRVEIREDDHD